MGNFFLFLIFYKFLIDKVLYLNKKSLSHKTSFNSVSKNNFLYYIFVFLSTSCLALERRRSGLRQATKTDKMSIRK